MQETACSLTKSINPQKRLPAFFDVCKILRGLVRRLNKIDLLLNIFVPFY
jgi:hypothetical protein